MNSFTAQYFLSGKTKSTKAKKKPVIWEMVNIDKILLQLRKGLAAHLNFSLQILYIPSICRTGI